METAEAHGEETYNLKSELSNNNKSSQKCNDLSRGSNCSPVISCSLSNSEFKSSPCESLTDVSCEDNVGSVLKFSPSVDQLEMTNLSDRKYENGDVPIELSAEAGKDSGLISKKYSISMKKKRRKILIALCDNDVESLKSAAVSEGGLLSDDIRKKVWPKLVGVDLVAMSPRPSTEEIENHPYYRQVVLDVNRSLKRFPPSIKEAQRLAMLDQLVLLIMRVLCKHPNLHYYQGYHDICVTFLLVLGEEMAYYVLEKLSRTHLSLFMKESMEHTLVMLNCMFPLISKKNKQLADFMLKSDVGVAYCVSWLITWFGHVLSDYDTVVRLFDFFLVSHPAMPLYLTSAIVLYRKDEVLQQECDMACVHSLLSHIPEDLPYETLLVESLELFYNHDYKILKKESSYLNENRAKIRHKMSLMQSIAKKIKSSVPASSYTISFMIAAAVLVTAILYQAYEH